jgi:hypothetical protein
LEIKYRHAAAYRPSLSRPPAAAAPAAFAISNLGSLKIKQRETRGEGEGMPKGESQWNAALLENAFFSTPDRKLTPLPFLLCTYSFVQRNSPLICV